MIVQFVTHTLIINENLLYLNRLLEGQVWFALCKRVFCSCAKPSHYLLITKEFNRWHPNIQSSDSLIRQHKNVILVIIKGSLSLFVFSLSWQLPGDSLVAICHLAGARLRCQPIRPRGPGWHRWHGHHQPRGGPCESLTRGLRSASDTWLLVIYSNNHQNTSQRLVTFSHWGLLILLPCVPTHARAC